MADSVTEPVTAKPPVLQLAGVRKSYGSGETETEILHGIDLTLQPGEFAALIGPSGSGKSTLLNLIGLLDRPGSGRLSIAGEETTALENVAMPLRVAIARALCMEPQLVLADEPTGNLDTHSADDVFALLRQINRQAGTSFLIVTHDPRLAARCDRIIELVDGAIVSDHANAIR